MASANLDKRNYTIASRVFSGALTSAGYQASIQESDRRTQHARARNHEMTLPELSDADLERIREELPGKIAKLRV